MQGRSILVATWDDGVFSVIRTQIHQELANRQVRGLTADGRGGVLAIVDEHSLCRRSADGQWTTLAETEFDLSCCVAVQNTVFIGTNEARMLRVESGGGKPQLVTSFDAVEGRGTWYAGAAIVDGKLMGPPLGIRSITATCAGVVLANVHVGGIPQSIDGGRTWRPTIDIEADVHQVCAHPTDPDVVIAAAAAGLCISHDAGATWAIEQRGLHALHCSAVAFGTNDVLVSASTDPFSSEGAVYRRAIDGNGPLQPLGGGFPQWTGGKVDTGCIATRDSTIAVIDQSGSLYVSEDDGVSWSRSTVRVPNPSGVFLA